jgi:parallel beta-helix repeat protein
MASLRRVARAAAAALLLFTITSISTVAHAASTALCGSLVTTNLTLTDDVGPCPADGLIAGANNITIDLNGHRIFGTSGPLSSLDAGVGVRIANHSNVTVTSGVAGGRIDHFDAGVVINSVGGSATGNVVSNLVLRDNNSENLTGADNGEGVAITGGGADDNTVQNNVIFNNGPFAGISVYGGTSANKITGTVISGNVIRDNVASSQTSGVRLENWTWDTTVSGNTIRNNAFDGVSQFADTQNITISGNTITQNGNHGDPSIRPGDGVHAFARTAFDTVTSNTVSRNGGHGIALDGPVATSAGANNFSITGNTALNNGQADAVIITVPPVLTVTVGRVSVVLGGMEVINLPDGYPFYDLSDENFVPPCDTNTWSGNTYGTRNQACIS